MNGPILSFFAGLCLLHSLSALPAGWLILLLGTLLVIACMHRATYWCAALIAGFVWGWWHANTELANRLPQALDGALVTVFGTVTGLPEVTDERVRFGFRIAHAQEQPRLTGTARLSWYDADVVPQPGEYWRLRVKLRRPRGFSNPRGFDYEGWLFRQKINATGYVRADGGRRLAGAGGRQPLARMRLHLGHRISASLAGQPLLPIVLAVTIGDRAQMTREHWRTLSATGTGHLMAISGLHIGMVAGFVLLAARMCWGSCAWLTRWLCAADAAVLMALLAALLYAAMAGFTLPTRRALVMILLALFALQRRRRINVARALSVALLLVVLIDPLAPLSPGFWLSFGAVAAIAWAMQGYYPAFKGPAAWARVQLAVSVGLVPLTLWQFGRVSLFAPAINLLLIPLFAVAVMPLLLTGGAVSLLTPEAGAVLLRIGTGVLALAWPYLASAAEFDAALWTPAPRPLWTLVVAMAGVALALSPLASRFWLLCAALLIPLIAWRPQALPYGAFAVDVLDVGQGLAAVVTTHNHRLIFDTGGRFRSGANLAELVLLPFLRGGPAPSVLVVSHADLDHRGGVDAVLNRFPRLELRGGEGMEGLAHKACLKGQFWHWDGVHFEILHPQNPAAWSGNNASCVLRVEGSSGAVILTGDIEAAAEAHLVASDAPLGADVVLAPHHGSNTSSTAAFIAASGARHVVFAAGHGNRWSFPRPQVVERWREANAQVWITGRDGAVSVRADASAGAVSVTAWRQRRGHYWSW